MDEKFQIIDENGEIVESGNIERDLKGIVASFVEYLMSDPSMYAGKEGAIENLKRFKNTRLFDDHKALQLDDVGVWSKIKGSLEHGIMNIIKRNL